MSNNTMEKRYGLPTAISMVIGIVIGSGVFIKGGKVLALTHGNMLQGVLVVALVIILLGGVLNFVLKRRRKQ